MFPVFNTNRASHGKFGKLAGGFNERAEESERYEKGRPELGEDLPLKHGVPVDNHQEDGRGRKAESKNSLQGALFEAVMEHKEIIHKNKTAHCQGVERHHLFAVPHEREKERQD